MATYKNTNGDYIINVNDGSGNLAVNANFSMAGGTATFAADDFITLTSPQTTINGNLNVVGNLTYINVQDLRIEDPFITVAGNNTGNVTTAAFQSQGIVAQTSSTTFAGIRFNNANLAWQISSSVNSAGAAVGAYSNIATSTGSYLIAAPTNAGTFGAATWPTQGVLAHTSSSTYAGLIFNNASSKWEISSNVTSAGAAISPYVPIVTAAAAPNNSIQFNVSNTFTGSANLTFDDADAQLRLNGYQVFGNIGAAPTEVANSVAIYSSNEGQGGTGLYVKSETVSGELVSKSRAIVFGLIL